MKISQSQLKQIIKEELNEISGEDPAYAGGAWGEKDREKVRQDNKRVGSRQKAHDDKQARQKAQRVQKESEAEELRQTLGNDWEVNVRMLEGYYQLTVNKAVWAQKPGTNPQENW